MWNSLPGHNAINELCQSFPHSKLTRCFPSLEPSFLCYACFLPPSSPSEPASSLLYLMYNKLVIVFFFLEYVLAISHSTSIGQSRYFFFSEMLIIRLRRILCTKRIFHLIALLFNRHMYHNQMVGAFPSHTQQGSTASIETGLKRHDRGSPAFSWPLIIVYFPISWIFNWPTISLIKIVLRKYYSDSYQDKITAATIPSRWLKNEYNLQLQVL